MRTGLDGLDQLMGGGIERGTSTLIQGAAGTGKSTIAALYCVHAAARGQKSALFVFDESVNTLTKRLDGLNVPFAEHLMAGRITVQPVDPAELSPGELIHNVLKAVSDGAQIIVIDSLNGYLNAMPDEQYLIVRLHELLTFLGQHGVATILIAAHQGLFGQTTGTQVDASYLADTVMLLRYFETEGEVKQAISVVKMRSGGHERTLREFSLKGGHITVGEPLRQYSGILTGVPEKISQP
jgi:circadian clock protein KaiC